MLQFSHLFSRMRKWKKVMYEEYCSCRVTERKEELALPWHHVKRFKRKNWTYLWEEVNWILYWYYLQCNAIQCNENKIPLQRQCLCSLCHVCLSSEKDLNLVYYLIPMWNSSMEPSGHVGLKSLFFVPLYSHWGCNNNSSSNHGQWLSKSKGMYIFIH